MHIFIFNLTLCFFNRFGKNYQDAKKTVLRILFSPDNDLLLFDKNVWCRSFSVARDGLQFASHIAFDIMLTYPMKRPLTMQRSSSLVSIRRMRNHFFHDRSIKPKELRHRIPERLHNALALEAKIWNNQVQKDMKPTYKGGIGSSERK